MLSNLFGMNPERFKEWQKLPCIRALTETEEGDRSRGWNKYLLGKLETDENNKSEAQKLYKEATIDADTALQLQTKISKKMSRYFHTRGAARAGIGDHQEAIEDFNESICLKPKKALFYHDRGVSNEALGQHEAAEADFAKAKELEPNIKGIFKWNKKNNLTSARFYVTILQLNRNPSSTL